MSPVAILFFLVGAVLAWGFRVWILVPITLLATVAAMVLKLALGASLLVAIADSLLLGLLPQVGYAFGLLARNALVMLRSPRGASVTSLHKRHSLNQIG